MNSVVAGRGAEIAHGPRDMVHVVIVGAGFGGLYAALELEKHMLPNVIVTLINRVNFFLFTPLLAEVAGSSIDTRHIVNPIRRMFKRVRFVEAQVEEIDLAERHIVARLADGSQRTFTSDYLVLALGSVTSYFGMTGVERNALGFKSLGDAIAIRNHVIAMLERADVAESAEERRRLLTFVVAGGGTTGIEVAGELNDLVRTAARLYRRVPVEDMRVLLVEGGPRLATELNPRLAEFVRQALEQHGVEVRLNTFVRDATERTCSLSDRTELPTSTLVWTAGVSPNPLTASLFLEHDRKGRIIVGPDLGVPGHADVWAVGDCALVPDVIKGGFFAGTAQNAVRQGKYVAHAILASPCGRPTAPFRYRVLGQLATVGHYKGVGTIGPLKVSGFPAWWLWRSYYLYRLPRLEKRLRVMFDWTLDLLFGRDIVQLSTATTKSLDEDRITLLS
jgi:NADH dehydrogenase